MIQDKIFFDEKDPTGVSYNTPFTVYGSYEGRLWSKTPSGTIKYYTQNSDLSVYATTGSNQFSGSQTVTGSLTVTGGITGSVTTASYVEYAGVANKPTLVSSSAQIVGYNIFATTGSNTFQSNQTITGSLFITQNLVVAGSSSIQYISSSVLDIADNTITVNTFNPSVRFGGLGVIDSGSSPQVSGSILFDSVKDQWIFVHQNQSVITSSVVLMGPETYDNLGNESYISSNRLPKGSGVEHLRDSNITDTGTVVSVNSNTAVTGSFTVVTGSAVELQVTNTGVNIGSALTDSHIISGSLRVNPNGLFVSGSGNVGIGTTNLETLSNNTTLQIDGTNHSFVRTGNSSYGGYFATIPTAEVLCIANVRNPVTGTYNNTGKAASGINLFSESSNGYITFLTTATNNSGPSERMRITSGGNFDYGGFNVQSSNNTTYRQAFYGALSIMWRNAEDSYINSNHTYGSSNTNVATYTSSNGIGRMTIGGGELVWATFNGSVTAGSAYALTDRFIINKAGNVGIGTPSPGERLTIQSAASGTAPQLKLQNPVDSNSSQGAANNLSAGQLLFGATGAFPLTARIESVYNSDASFGRSADLVFSGANGSGTLTERMRLTVGGLVRIPSFTTNGLVGTDSSGNLRTVSSEYTEIATGTITYSMNSGAPWGINNSFPATIRNYEDDGMAGSAGVATSSNLGRGVTFDLGSAKAVRKIVERGYNTKNLNTIIAQYSTDNSNWTDIYVYNHVYGNTQKNMEFNPTGAISARYWRWFIHDWSEREVQNYYTYESIIYT